MQRTGIILAAGIGSRMNSENKENLIKPLAPVDDLMLLGHTIRSLEICSCEKIVVVLGWQAQKIQKQICSYYKGSMRLDFVYNEHYLRKNGISVLCARPLIKGEFVLTMADHILDDKIMQLVRNDIPPIGGATLCVDYKLDTIFDIDDATKVLSNRKVIKKIGKHITEYNCIDTGVFIGTEGLFEAIDHVYKKNGDVSLSEGVQQLADKGLMKILDIKDAYWQDVDNYDMLGHAELLLRANKKNIKTYLPKN